MFFSELVFIIISVFLILYCFVLIYNKTHNGKKIIFIVNCDEFMISIVLLSVIIIIAMAGFSEYNKKYLVVERYDISEIDGYDLSNDTIAFIDDSGSLDIIYINNATNFNIEYIEYGESYIEIYHNYSDESTLIGSITISSPLTKSSTAYINKSKIKTTNTK